VVRREIKAKLVKEERQVYQDKVEFPEKGVLKVKQGQGGLLDRGDYRGILASEVRLVRLDLRALQVHQEFRVFKA